MNNPRIVIWFVSNDGRFIDGALNILESQFNGVDIIGVTAAQKISIEDLPFIPLNEISMNGGGGYDVLLVVGARNFGMSEVTKIAKQLGLDTDKLLGDWITCIPGFTLQKYRQLQRSQLSIFSINCFGGTLCKTLGLQFRSPFINMFLSAEDYLKFLRCPRVYMEEKLIFQKTAFEHNLKFDYPIYTLGNISLHMNHYRNFDEAVEKWEDRKKRINWYNLFVTMSTENQETLEQFDDLPYGKKVCFVTFKSNLDSTFYLNPKFQRGRALSEFTFDISRGLLFYYDPFDMLLYGKKTPLIEM